MVSKTDLETQTDDLVKEVARKLSDQMEEKPVEKEEQVEEAMQWRGQRWSKYGGEEKKQENEAVGWKGQAWTKYA